MKIRDLYLKSILSENDPMMVFDWNQAAQLIVEKKCKNAYAGLSGDWDYTGGIIYKNGNPVPGNETYTYLASRWAIPEIEIDRIIYPCWIYQKDHPEWNAHTYWPDSALQILNQK